MWDEVNSMVVIAPSKCRSKSESLIAFQKIIQDQAAIFGWTQ